MFFLFLLTLALSVDSLCVSFQYAITQKMLSTLHFFIISLTTFLLLILMQVILFYFPIRPPERLLDYIGLVLFLFLGITTFRSRNQKDTINVDFNHSGTIQFFEAEILSILLSLDSLVVLLTLPLTPQYRILFPLLISLSEWIFLITGNYIGKKALQLHQEQTKMPKIIKCITALLFIILGVLRFFLH